MNDFILSILAQSLTFFPLAFGISVSYHILRATDMTIDGSFVLGAAIFARFVSLGFSPYLAAILALTSGATAGLFTASIQRSGRVNPLLSGVLATFILSSFNLFIMGKPNINLLQQSTLLSNAFTKSDFAGWSLVAFYTTSICSLSYFLIHSRFGLRLRAFGDNPKLLQRLGKNIEMYRVLGFALTNSLAAAAGLLTAQTIGYADIGMGLGMTLTGIGAIILGQQFLKRFTKPRYFRIGFETIACLIGVLMYFLLLNTLIRIGIDPIYLKMILGLSLILFLRTSLIPYSIQVAS